jgi:hypothetical protein
VPAYGTLVWLIVAIAAGAAVGGFAPERGRRPASVAWWGVIGAGVGLRLLVEVADLPAGVLLLMASYALLLVALWRNRAWTGTPIVALGLAACALAASLNGGTPVSADALEAVGRGTEAARGGALPGERHVEVERDRLTVLGDLVPVPLTRHVTSFGELIVLVGAANVAFNVTARRPARRRRAASDVTADGVEALAGGPEAGAGDAESASGTGHDDDAATGADEALVGRP